MSWFRQALFLTLASTVGISIAATGRADDGKALFLEKRCNLCHSIDSQGIAKTSDKMKGPDLSNAGGGLIPSAEWARSFLKREVQKDGENHKREFKGTDEELDAIIDWLMTLKTS